MTANETGFLLSYTKFGDQDAVLHCFTQESGFDSYFVRGIYSPKNKKKAFLLPLNEISISISQKNGTLKNITKIENAATRNFESPIKANAVIFFISDLLNGLLREESASPRMYAEISAFMDALESGNYQSHLLFLFSVLKIQGVAPLLSTEPFLDPESGNFSGTLHHKLFHKEVSEVWKSLVQATKIYESSIPRGARKDFLDSLLVYFHYHLPGFKTPASLDIIKQIFE